MFRALRKNNKGVSALPMILIFSSIVLEVVVAALVVSGLLSDTIAAEQASLIALETAKSGAQDAIVRVNRYCTDGTIGGNCPASYDFAIGSNEACVSMSESGNVVTVYSRGTASGNQKYVRANLSLDTAKAAVSVQSFKEVQNPGDFDDSGC